jgi:hypothetical protein
VALFKHGRAPRKLAKAKYFLEDLKEKVKGIIELWDEKQMEVLADLKDAAGLK